MNSCSPLERPFYERCTMPDCKQDDYDFSLIDSPCFACLSDYEKRILLDNYWLIAFFDRSNPDADMREAQEYKERNNGRQEPED